MKTYIIDGFKVCSRCGENKSVADYHMSGKKPEEAGENTAGIKSHCKVCQKTIKAEYLAKIPKVIKPQIDLSTITSKVCTVCKVDKPLEQYLDSKLGYLKKRSNCKDCGIKYKREKRAKDSIVRKEVKAIEKVQKLEEIQKRTSKVCPSCKVDKTLDQYSKDSQTIDKLSCYCSECNRERQRAATYGKIIERTKKDDRIFITYFFDNGRSGDEREIKIGRAELKDKTISEVVNNRLTAAKTYSGTKVSLMANTQTGDYGTEYRIHKKFESMRKYGEWFNYSPSLLRFIQEIQTKTTIQDLHDFIEKFEVEDNSQDISETQHIS